MSKTKQQHHDPAPMWERMVHSPKLERFPSEAGLDRWETEQIQRFDAEARTKKAPLALEDVVALLRGSMPSGFNEVERVIVGVLATACWGEGHVQASLDGSMKQRRQEQIEGTPPFAGVNEVLWTAVYGEAELGRGRGRDFNIAENREKLDRSREGLDFAALRPTQRSWTGVASIGRVDLQIDARRGLRAANLGPLDTFGVLASRVGLVSGSGSPKKLTPGEVAERIRAIVCASSATPGAAPCPCRGAAIATTARQKEAVIAKRLGKKAGKLARSLTPKKAKSEAVIKSLALREAELDHAETCPARALSCEVISKRLARARNHMVRTLAELRLIPPPVDRGLSPEEKRAAKDRKRRERLARIEPIYPSFFSDL